ncbi:MAG: hypothetical protein ACLQHK_00250 [Gallionellaceae bacterium]
MELESSARAICHFHHNTMPGSLFRFLFQLVASMSAANRTSDGGQILAGSSACMVAQHTAQHTAGDSSDSAGMPFDPYRFNICNR